MLTSGTQCYHILKGREGESYRDDRTRKGIIGWCFLENYTNQPKISSDTKWNKVDHFTVLISLGNGATCPAALIFHRDPSLILASFAFETGDPFYQLSPAQTLQVLHLVGKAHGSFIAFLKGLLNCVSSASRGRGLYTYLPHMLRSPSGIRHIQRHRAGSGQTPIRFRSSALAN